MIYRFILVLCLGSFMVIGAQINFSHDKNAALSRTEDRPNDKWKIFDSLIKVNQPNAAREVLWKILNEGIETKTDTNIVQAFQSFSVTLPPLLPDERVDLFVKLDSISSRLHQPAKSLSQVVLVNQLMSMGGYWIPYGANPEPRIVEGDTIALFSDHEKAKYVFKRVDEIKDDLEKLKQFSFDAHYDYLVKSENDRAMFPTVFDYVSHQLISIYHHHYYSRYYELKYEGDPKTEWFENPDEFVKADFSEASLKHKVLSVFQSLEEFHLNEKHILSKVHYRRMLYTTDQIEEEKLEKWQKAFEYYGENPERSKFLYEIARLKNEKGRNYHFKNNPEVENEIKEAHELLKKEIKMFPKNDFAKLIEGLIEIIEQPQTRIEMQNMAYPGDPIPFKITHQNVEELQLRIYAVPREYDSHLDLRDYIHSGKAKMVREKFFNVTDKGDFQSRETSTLLDGIAEGGDYYFFLTDKGVDLNEMTKADSIWRRFPKTVYKLTVSEIFVKTLKSEKGIDFLVTNYKSGKPIEGAKVEIYYHRNFKILPNTPNKTGSTNKDGWYRTSLNHDVITYFVSYKDSKLSSGDYFYDYNYSEGEDDISILTDRAIYRPGQTVYFKMIAFRGRDNEFKVQAGEELEIKVMDNSWNEVYTTVLKTNDFGSANGSFVLPLTGPLGNFQLEAKYVTGIKNSRNFSKNFSVEEYKRPTFEATINQPEGEAKLNDTVKVTGNVKALAGYPITGAQVNYRVYRTWNTYWRYYGGYDQGRDLILDSTMNSDENGEFEIKFFSETDPNAPDHAHYNFEIIAEISDVSGETHEARTNLNLSKTGLRLSYSGSSELIAGKENKAVLKVLNMAGKEQEGFSGKIEIYRIEESPYFQSRIWSDAEFQQFDEDKWRALFPYAPLSSYDQPEPKEELIESTSFKVGDSIKINELLKNKQGNYRLNAYTFSKNGDTIRLVQPLSMLDLKSKNLPKPTDLWTYLSDNQVNVGGQVIFQIGSSFNNAQAFVQLRRGQEIIREQWINLKERKQLSYTITEKDRGNINYNVILIHDGKSYTSNESIYVPFDNKELTIKTAVFRDKLLPGQDEEWRFTVSGKDADKIAAEVCAGMYDASLDQFAANYWSLWPYRGNYFYPDWRGPIQRSTSTSYGQGKWNRNDYSLRRMENDYRQVPLIQLGGVRNRYVNYYYENSGAEMSEVALSRSVDMDESMEMEGGSVQSAQRQKSKLSEKKEDVPSEMSREDKAESANRKDQPMQIRKNFNETAFFYPELKTNENGEFVVSFTLPESLTEWKFMALAHTKDMKSGQLNLEAVAQKPIMVTSNAPRFFRVGDQFDFSSKVVNLTEKEQTVEVALTFSDLISEKNLNLIGRQPQTKMITVPANQSKEVTWHLDLSDQSGLITYKITASNEEFSDGEQKPIPVLTNRQLITEAFPFVLTDQGRTELTFKSLKQNNSSTIKHERVTFEYTSNPAWNAVLALPYLQEFPYECAEQVFSRYYANTLAHNVVESKPKIKTLFETWRNLSPEVFMSELQKNEELKTILLEETPWVLDAKNEAERKKRIGELFEMNQLSQNLEKALHLLKQQQNSDGGFGWFGGNRSNIYITQHIVSGFGHLKNLEIELPEDAEKVVDKAISFLNNHHTEVYNKMTAKQKEDYTFSSIALHWLYSTAYFLEQGGEKTKEVKKFYNGKLKKHWTKLGLQQHAMAGMYFLSQNDENYSKMILASLQDRAKNEKLKGMYFPENRGGYYWDEDMIGTQALIIEFFAKSQADQKEIDALRLWLILQKRSNAWESTKSTALATYALLLNGTDYLEDNQLPTIQFGNETLVYSETNKENERFVEVTPGLGHFQTTWNGTEVNKDLSEIVIDKPTSTPSYGAIYWKYFENMSKVKASSNSEISIKKTYRRVVAGDKGDEYIQDSIFKIGERVSIELVITVENDLEFVHVKDLRPAGFEPKMAVSRHHWQSGLWYYQSPRDVSMNYFIDRLPKGSHTLTYEVFVSNSGRFDSGNATVQCMYAPEFVAHSRGDVIRVER